MILVPGFLVAGMLAAREPTRRVRWFAGLSAVGGWRPLYEGGEPGLRRRRSGRGG